MTDEKTPLTQEQKQKIYKAIAANMSSDDRDPQEVIAEDCNGDEEKYLRAMAR